MSTGWKLKPMSNGWILGKMKNEREGKNTHMECGFPLLISAARPLSQTFNQTAAQEPTKREQGNGFEKEVN